MRRVRELAREALAATEPDLSTLSDTGLFEVLSISYRRGMTHDAAIIVGELFRRMNPRAAAGHALVPVFNPVTVADKPADSVTVTTHRPGYPLAVKALAVKLLAQGATTPEIRAAIEATGQRAPDVSNAKRTFTAWARGG
jgi:hypothetical protein